MHSRLSTYKVYFQAFKRYFKNPKLASKYHVQNVYREPMK